jgi:hypothetical protein
MINNLNIRGYINYLYLQRNGNNAPQELLQKWSNLSTEEIQLQLQNLYASWQLQFTESNEYEKNYIQAITATIPVPQPIVPTPPPNIVEPHQIQTHQTQEARPYISQKKSNNILLWILVFLLIGGLLVFAISKIKNSNTTSVANTIAPTENNLPSVAPPIVEEPIINFDSAKKATETAIALPQPDNAASEEDFKGEGDETEITDNQNKDAIQQLIEAEEQRDFEKIYSYYSPSMEKYWDIKYPTRNELQTKFSAIWGKTANPKHTNITIKKYANNSYIATGNYEYYGLISKSIKSVTFKTIYKFDENGKIILEDDAR